MLKHLLSICLILNYLATSVQGQACAITEIAAVALSCEGNNFSASVDLEVDNPASDSFTIAGNGVIYGTFAYADAPITVGPLFGDGETEYEFIVWDINDAECQDFTVLPAADCGPICSISNFELEFVACVSNNSALVVFDFDYENPGSPTFDLINEEGEVLSTWLYESLPVTLPFFEVNGAAPIVLSVCDSNNDECCETFVLDAIDCNPNNCEIFSVSFDPECTGPNFLLTINFGYDNPPSDSFHMTGNTINYGTFAYSELPITVGPLNGGTNIEWVFNIEDAEDDGCNNMAMFGIYHCPPPCDVLAMEALALECNGNEAYSLMIGMDIEGEGDLGFAVFSQTAYYGSYMYNELPLTLPYFEGSGEFIDIVSVCDNENLGCCMTTPFEALLCAGCLIYNLEVFPLPCNDDDEIFVQIDFDYNNQSNEGFEITGNGENYGEFAYEDLPVQVGPFPGDGSQYFEFVITDLVNPLCFEAVELGFIDCDTICELSNLTIDIGECSGNNTFVATIDFDYQGVSGVGFDLYINGDNFGFYDYDDLPLTIGEFPSNGTGTDTIKVCENDNNNCCATLIFDSPLCACNIYDLSVTTLDCTTDSTFEISVEYFYENLPGEAIDVFLDGVFLGFYNVDEIPLILDIQEGVGTAVLSICANDLGSCCDEVLIELINCELPVCSINDLFIETGDCSSDSTYLLDIVFETENNSADSILVYANGNLVGTYQIAPDFNRIENFPVMGTDSTLLVVCAQGDPECCDTLSFETPDCSNFGQCSIWDLVAEFDECESDSSYIIHIDFNSQNLPTDSVTITANGEELGQFEVTDGFIAINNVPAFDSSLTTIVVCAVGAPDCCADIQIETPDCSTFGQCTIWDLVAELDACDSDSTYILHIDFNYENLPTDSVTVSANGDFIGQYEITPEFIAINNFPVSNNPITIITVCAVGAPDCCDEVEIETPDCSNFGQCNIWDLVVEFDECDSDSTYILHIDFNYEYLPTDSVTVSANGDFIGQYEITPEFIAINNFPVSNNPITNITVCAVGAPDCCAEVEIETPDCTNFGQCNIWDLVVDLGDCTSDSTYTLLVNFNSQNLPTDSVLIYGNGDIIGQYLVTDNPITIEHFPTFGTDNTTLTVCAVGAPDCCDVIEFDTPNCDDFGLCNIFDLVVDTGDCNGDTTYALFIHYFANNLPTDSVVVTSSNGYVGQFEHNPDGFTIPDFPVAYVSTTTITVCAVGNNDCCDNLVFETPDCGQEFMCEIASLFAEVGDCTSDTTFLVDIVFNGFSLPSDSVDIYANDILLGTYFDHPDFIRIENFPILNDFEMTITVCAQGNEECCASYIIASPNCSGDCSITEISVDVFDCNSDSTFVIVANFDYDNLPGGGVDIYSGDDYLGFFSFDQIPVEINNFPSDDSGDYTITICESDGTECCNSFSFPGPVCGSGGCNIFDLEYTMTPCDSAGNFFFVLDFNFVNTGNEGFNVAGNGNDYGNFSYDNVPLELGPFAADETVYEFIVFDAANPDCSAVIEPGVVSCFVSTLPVDYDAFFTVFNNGTMPGIYAKKELVLSLYNSSGRNVIYQLPLSADAQYELNSEPAGLYIAMLKNGENIWPIKLVKSGN